MARPVTKEQLSQRVAATHKANQHALKATEHRSQQLGQAARESVRVVDQAVRKLRTGH
jgi:hypothetical protein